MRRPLDAASQAWSTRGAAYAVSAPHVQGPSLSRLLALARPIAGDLCLDLGTGAGHTAATLARAGAEVVGVDPSAGMLAAARQRYGDVPGLRFVEAPGHATGVPGGSVDLVTARHTLHHHSDLPATLREVARVLKPGGRFVMVDEITPDPSVDAWLDGVQRERDATHVRAYRMDEWRAMLAAAGLAWVVGDADTVYRLEVDAWIARMELPRERAAAVRRRFREAGARERAAFSIRYDDEGEAVTFGLPMALILAQRAPTPARPAEGDPV